MLTRLCILPFWTFLKCCWNTALLKPLLKYLKKNKKMCKLTSLISMLFAPESMEFSSNSLTTDDTEVMT